LKDGKPFRAIGINYFNAFSRTIENADDTSYLKGFDELSKRGIPFIRFMAGGYWPKDWALYRQDPEEYFRRFDRFVKAAEEKGLGLVPSLFWYTAAVPDLVGEPRNQWGNSRSKTMAFMRKYVEDIVGRYRNSPAIWMWELGNEYSLDVDLPNAADHRPPVIPELGTASSRSEADDLTHDMLVVACTEFAKAVRKFDAVHPITTGHSLPRPSACHQRVARSWEPASRAQLTANLLDVTPEPCNVISVHVYPFSPNGCFGEKRVSYSEILALCMDAARRGRKSLFVGEFGVADADVEGGPDRIRQENAEIVEAIVKSGVPLAALWVFDLAQQEDSINVTPTNQRAYLLDELEKANRRISSESGHH